MKLRKIPQPPVNPVLRDPEHHDFWLGFIVAIIGFVLAVCGARNSTGVDTVDGGTAWETQLIRAFSVGGVQYASRMPGAPPPALDGSAAAAEALDRWTKSQGNAAPPTWKIRIDTTAKTPCPT